MSRQHSSSEQFRHRLLVWVCLSGAFCAGCQAAKPRQPGDLRAEDRELAPSDDRPPTAESLHAAARVVAGQGRNAECEFLLTRIIREHPQYLPAYADLAELRMRQRQVDQAVRALQAGLKHAPRDGVLLNNMALCKIIKGDFEGALAAATQAVAVQPHNARYRANLATVLGLMGRREEALALFEQILPREDAFHNVAVLYEARGELVRGTNGLRTMR